MPDGSLSILRTQLDGNEQFVNSHGVIKTAGATRHAERMRRVPVWVLDDDKVDKFVNFVFPKNPDRAEVWRQIIYLYWRVGYTRGQVAAELNMSYATLSQILKRMKRTLRGRRGFDNKPRGVRPRGRPKKMLTPIPNTSGGTGF